MEEIRVDNQKLYRFESEFVGTNMYVLFSDGEALIVDPHPDKEAEQLLKKNNPVRATVFLTHGHPDHTCGIPWLKEKISLSVVCQQSCAARISVEKNNRPYLITFVLAQKDKEQGTHLLEKFEETICPYTVQADVTFEKEMQYDWHGNRFCFTATPGHSKGSCCIKMNDAAVFTGDNLIWDTPVITRFPGGSLKEFNEKTKPYLDALPDDILVLAGHGRVFKMKEAR